MIYRERQNPWRPLLRLILPFCLALTCGLIPFAVLAADDDYLKAITMEGEKVGKRVNQGQPQNDGGMPRRAGEGFSSDMSIEEFETELREKYAGSAVFYKKLQRRSQEEVYQDYLSGAPYSEVREKIVKRFLKRR